jgi:hypothetical protein
MGLIFLLLLWSTTFEAAHDPHAQPPDVGQAVQVVHTSCRVPATCSAHHPRFAVDGRRHVDGAREPVAFGYPLVPPSIWQDHGDAT